MNPNNYSINQSKYKTLGVHCRFTPNYPKNNNHVECFIREMPFVISRGDDPYYYNDENGVERMYNKNNEDNELWIIHMSPNSNETHKYLHRIFHIKTSFCLDELIEYAIELYQEYMIQSKTKWDEVYSDFKKLNS